MGHSALRYSIATIISLLLQIGTLIIVTIIAFIFHNWWLLFGIFFSYGGATIYNTKVRYLILILITTAYLVYWNNKGFDVHQLVSFYFVCFIFGFIMMMLYKLIGYGDNLSRAMIAAAGNLDAKAKIEKDIEEGMKKWRDENKPKDSE